MSQARGRSGNFLLEDRITINTVDKLFEAPSLSTFLTTYYPPKIIILNMPEI